MGTPQQETLQGNNVPIISIPLNICVVVSVQDNKPCIWLRSQYTDVNVMRHIITAAFQGIPIVLLPSFSNRLRSISSLIEKGIIYEKDGTYYFNY